MRIDLLELSHMVAACLVNNPGISIWPILSSVLSAFLLLHLRLSLLQIDEWVNTRTAYFAELMYTQETCFLPWLLLLTRFDGSVRGAVSCCPTGLHLNFGESAPSLLLYLGFTYSLVIDTKCRVLDRRRL